MSFTPFYPVMPLYDHSFPHFLPWSCREPEADSWISLPLLILYAFLGFICFRCCLIPSAGVTASLVEPTARGSKSSKGHRRQATLSPFSSQLSPLRPTARRKRVSPRYSTTNTRGLQQRTAVREQFQAQVGDESGSDLFQPVVPNQPQSPSTSDSGSNSPPHIVPLAHPLSPSASEEEIAHALESQQPPNLWQLRNPSGDESDLTPLSTSSSERSSPYRADHSDSVDSRELFAEIVQRLNLPATQEAEILAIGRDIQDYRDRSTSPQSHQRIRAASLPSLTTRPLVGPILSPAPLPHIIVPPPQLPLSQNMAAQYQGPAVGMPLRGERTCPSFKTETPASLIRYFKDLEVLFTRHTVAGDDAKKWHAVYYTDETVEYIWSGQAGYADATVTYDAFKLEILSLYGYKSLAHRYTRQDLQKLTTEYAADFTTGFTSLERYQAFYRVFHAVTTYLRASNSLSQVEAALILMSAFKGEVERTVQVRLDANQTYMPDAPDLAIIHEAAQFALKKRVNLTLAGSGSAEGTALLTHVTTPAPPPAAESSTVKREELDSFFEQINQQMATFALQLGGRSSAPPPPVMNDPFCFYCGRSGCHTRRCPSVQDDLQRGLIQRGMDGRILLANGMEVPREIPGPNIRARIQEWHRRQASNTAQGSGGRAASGNSQAPVGQFIYTVAADASFAGASEDWVADALKVNLAAVEERKKSRMVFDGVEVPRKKPGYRREQQTSRPTQAEGPSKATPPAQTTSTVTARPAPTVAAGSIPVAPQVRPAPAPTAAAEPRDQPPHLPPLHPYAQARAVRVDAAQRPPALPARNPARLGDRSKQVFGVANEQEVASVTQRLLDQQISMTGSELLSIAPGVRKRIHEATTARRVHFRDATDAEAKEVDEMIADIRAASVNTLSAPVREEQSPPRAYIEEVDENDEDEAPTLLPAEEDPQVSTLAVTTTTSGLSGAAAGNQLVVGPAVSNIRAVWAQINDSAELVECLLDPGSQIVAISEALFERLRLAYNPEITLPMSSANGGVDPSMGMAANVPFHIPGSGITFYLQMHITKAASFDVLLGRPFDELARTCVETGSLKEHRLTITCPNTGTKARVPTFDRGCPPPSQAPAQEQDF